MKNKKKASLGVIVAGITFLATVVGLIVNVVSLSDRFLQTESQNESTQMEVNEKESIYADNVKVISSNTNTNIDKQSIQTVFSKEQFKNGPLELTMEPLFQVTGSVSYYVMNNDGVIFYYDEKLGLLKTSLGNEVNIFDKTAVESNQAALVYNSTKDEVYLLYAHLIFEVDSDLNMTLVMRWEPNQDMRWRDSFYTRSAVFSNGDLFDLIHKCVIDTENWKELYTVSLWPFDVSIVNDSFCQYHGAGGEVSFYDKSGKETQTTIFKYMRGYDEMKYGSNTKYFFGDNGIYGFAHTDGIMYYFDGTEEYAIPAYSFDKSFQDSMNNETFKNGNTILFISNGWLYKGYVAE